MSPLLTTMILQDPTPWSALHAFIKTNLTQTENPLYSTTLTVTTTKTLPVVYLTHNLQDTQTQALTHNVVLEELHLVIDEPLVDPPLHTSMTWTEVGLLLQSMVTDLLL